MDTKKALKDHGLRVTKKREEILKALAEEGGPVSAEKIFERLKKAGEDIDLSTVYRNLKTLEDANLLIKNTNLDGISYYQVKGEDHKHVMVCAICHKKVLIDHCPLEEVERDLERETGYQIIGHNVEFTGICPDCQKKLK